MPWCQHAASSGSSIGVPLTLVAVNPGMAAVTTGAPRARRTPRQRAGRQSDRRQHYVEMTSPPQYVDTTGVADSIVDAQETTNQSNDGDETLSEQTEAFGDNADGTEVAGAAAWMASNGYATYTGLISARIRAALRYPPAALTARMEGTVKVAFWIAPNGRLRSVRLAEPSRYVLLNYAAKAAVRRAAPFPSLPADAPDEPVSFSVPLRFFLSGAGR